MEKCGICGKGYLKRITHKEIIHNVCLGKFSAEKCSHCGEILIDGKTMERIEIAAKKKGVWGLKRNARRICSFS